MDGKEVLNPDNTSSVFNTVLHKINAELEHKCCEEAVRLRNAHPIRQSIDDNVPGHKYVIPGLTGTMFVVHHVWAIWFIVRRWVWVADMPASLVADETGLGKTFNSVAAAMVCNLLTEKVVMGLLLAILSGNTLADWVNIVQTIFSGIISEEQEWYPLRRHNSVPRRLLQIHKFPLQGKCSTNIRH